MSTNSGTPFSFTLPEDSDLADLVGVFLKPALQTLNTYGVHTTATQTLTNKTLTSPTLTTPSLTNPTVGTGVLTLQAGTAGAPALTTSGDTNTGTFYPAADTIAWATGGSERVRMDSSGNVGIGTSSPIGRITVVAPAGGEALTLVGRSADGYARLGAYDRSATVRTGAIAFFEDGSIDFSRSNTGTTTSRMVIDSSGNVGIGTSSPVAGLHVVSSAAYDARIEGGYPQGVTIQNGGFWEHKYATDTADISFNYVGYNNGTTYYRDVTIWNGKSGLIAKFQGSTSRLGIGTSSPSYALDVASNSTVYTARFKSPAANGSIVTIDTTDSNRDANLTLANAGTTKWWFISSSSNSYRLYINDADANDGVYMAQNATSWTANSDSRLKDVQGTITDALAKVGQLTGVKFTWKREADNPDAKVRVGLIAQDVQAVLPEAVDDESPDLITDEETGRVSGGLGVRYTELVPLLVNAIKELTARVVTLEQAVA